MLPTRRAWLAAGAAPLAACGGGDDEPAPAGTRSWRMAFSPTPPRPTVQAVLQGIEL